MRKRLLRFGFLALSLSPLFAACGSDSKEFTTDGADAGEGGDMTGAAATGSGGEGTTMGDGGAAGAAGAPVDEGGAGGAPPAAAGAAGQGGEGGMPYVCDDVDQDRDGVSECDGDCKPGKPEVFPGNAEVCGDGLDNDCSFTVDDPCGGLGTYVSALAGDDANPGTKLLPVKTIAQGMTNALTIQATTQGAVDVFVAQGDYIEKVTLSDGISLLGGHNCSDLTSACDWFRDPSLYTSTITNTDVEGVLAGHTVFASTRIDGFTIVGKLDNTAGAYPGTAAITVDGGSPTISNNLIIAGDSMVAFNWFTARSVGIAVLAPTNDPVGVVIQDNTITAGDSLAHSTGILFDAPGTTASPFKTYAVVTGNTISSGAGRYAWGILAANTGDGTLIQGNTIAGGEADGAEASSWGIYIQGRASIDSNRINLRPAAPSCSNTSEFCGGVFSVSSTSEITNNVIRGVTAAGRSAGVYMGEFEVAAGSVVLNSNTIDGGGNKDDDENLSAAVALFKGDCCGTTTALVGRIANNILLAGSGANRFGLWETNTPGRTIHPDWLFNNAFYTETSDTPNVAAYYRLWDGGAYVTKALIADVNTPHAQFATLGDNIDGDCALDATYHLQSGSACIDAGVSYDAPAFDYEGDARPFNDDYDIGADEAD